jgi:hypothetical protein
LSCCLVVALLPVGGAFAQSSPQTSVAADAPDPSPPSAIRQTREDAWWTGPMLANSAETLPPGHFLIEPYVYDVTSSRSDGFGSRAYVLYGLAENLTVGFIPIVGYNRARDGGSSSGVGIGDITLQAQYRLTEFHEGSWFPTIAIQLQESLPTANYDRLGNRPGNGLGSGARATTVGFNSQTYFWLPNGRILRMRFNVSKTFSGSADVEGVSVYGTDGNFLGNATPGRGLFVDASWEYSLTRRWVLALDSTWSHNSNTRVTGMDVVNPDDALPLPGIRLDSGSSVAFGLAPAIEYSWTPNAGVLLGTRVIFRNRRTPATVTPALAFNYVY